MKGKDEAMLKKRTLQTCAAIAATALVACHAAAEVRYVNASNYGLAGLDGRSPTTAWGTLQDAHDNANDDFRAYTTRAAAHIRTLDTPIALP